MFIMNADGTGEHLVSTGKGTTTFGYFLPDNKHIVYASTHLAGDACPTPPDRSKGYVWGVFAGFDIFVYAAKRQALIGALDSRLFAATQAASRHLEIEAYTWEWLPPDLRLDLLDSLHREYLWVLEEMGCAV